MASIKQDIIENNLVITVDLSDLKSKDEISRCDDFYSFDGNEKFHLVLSVEKINYKYGEK